ncbi:uncharacterized protein LOC106456330 [Tachysurus ichikawai]
MRDWTGLDPMGVTTVEEPTSPLIILSLEIKDGPKPSSKRSVATGIVDQRIRQHKWVEHNGPEVHERDDHGNTKNLFRIIQDPTGLRSSLGVPIKDKNGRRPLTKEEQDTGWIKHFRETMNQPPPETPLSFVPGVLNDYLAMNLGYRGGVGDLSLGPDWI